MNRSNLAQEARKVNPPPQEIRDIKKERKIIEHHRTGSYTYASLARIFKVSRQRVHNIVKRAKAEGSYEATR